MSSILTEIDQALAAYDGRHGRPVAIYLGERQFTRLTLDAATASRPPELLTDAGRPLTYRGLELLRDDVNVDALRVI